MLHFESRSPQNLGWNPPEDGSFMHEQNPIASGSPVQDHSSPLSPVPEPVTTGPTLQHLNPHMALAEEKEAPLEIPQREEEEEDESAAMDNSQQASSYSSAPQPNADKQASSRSSTPLSEPPPDQDDDFLDTIPTSSSTNGAQSSMSSSTMLEHGASDLDMSLSMSGMLKDPSSSSSDGSGARGQSAVDKPNGNGIVAGSDAASEPRHSDGILSSTSKTMSGVNSSHNSSEISLSGVSSNSSVSLSPTHHQAHHNSHDSSFTPGTAPHTMGSTSQDPRALTVLELNADLFKICLFLQTKGMPTSDPRFQL
ncbi:hypothetical protein CPB83DRAFT_898777 [Crepidotus variabilis]|uniref:Uncharacterized protein n=1 Tax=Crepidotus variabilis TaxID=179855 RepID=A0A9P6JJZ1_9AGAR|nr:hypothetical protein CPB83DRAFT_898777 [Crepidotus variabilis]